MRHLASLTGMLTLAVALLGASAAHALGLGDISVSSRLNQRLEARLPLLGLRSGERESVIVRVADAGVYEAAGVARTSLLSSLRFEVVEGDGGTGGFVRVTSLESIREPAFDLIIEVGWSGGRLLREYAIALSPP